MKFLTKISCLLAAGLIATSGYTQQYRIFINPASRVTVYGATNVNQFRFRYTEVISIDKPINVKRQKQRT